MHILSALKNTNWQAPSFAYILAGRFVVFENSKTTCPSNSGSIGVTFTTIPHLAYVLLPTQMMRISRGTLNVSIVFASAKLFGGKIKHSLSEIVFETKFSLEKFFGIFQQMERSCYFLYSSP